MSVIRLGTKPHQLVVNLYPGTDFIAVIRTRDGKDWPAGTSAELVFLGGTSEETFTATTAGSAISFDETEVTVDALIALKPKRARLYYINGTTRLPWAVGGISVG